MNGIDAAATSIPVGPLHAESASTRPRWRVGSRLGKRRPSHRAFTVLGAASGIFVCTNGPSTYLNLHVINGGGGVRAWVTLYPFSAVSVGGLLALGRHLRGRSPRDLPVVFYAIAAYVGWALMSALWSVSSLTTSVESMIGVGVAAFGCWFGWCLTTSEQINALVLACSAAVLSSAVVIWRLPQYGKMFPTSVPDRYWQGIFGNRNSLAPVCVLGLVALIGYVASQPSLRRIAIAVPLAVVHAVVLRGSSAATSLAALGLAVVVGLLIPAIWLIKRAGLSGRIGRGAPAAADAAKQAEAETSAR